MKAKLVLLALLLLSGANVFANTRFADYNMDSGDSMGEKVTMGVAILLLLLFISSIVSWFVKRKDHREKLKQINQKREQGKLKKRTSAFTPTPRNRAFHQTDKQAPTSADKRFKV